MAMPRLSPFKGMTKEERKAAVEAYLKPLTEGDDIRQQLEDLRGELHVYEIRYELSSKRLQGELDAGRIRDTFETTKWLMAWEAYQKLSAGGAAK